MAPGNFAGGLSTIEEKSMGAFAKSGGRPIRGAAGGGASAPAGLWLLDSVPDPHFLQFGYTNPNDSEGILDLAAAAPQMVLFVTGRGSVIGSAIAPLMKVTGNSRTYQQLIDDMDFDASGILRGEQTLDEAASQLEALVTAVAAGRPSKPEALGHREYFVMYKYQDASRGGVPDGVIRSPLPLLVACDKTGEALGVRAFGSPLPLAGEGLGVRAGRSVYRHVAGPHAVFCRTRRSRGKCMPKGNAGRPHPRPLSRKRERGDQKRSIPCNCQSTPWASATASPGRGRPNWTP